MPYVIKTEVRDPVAEFLIFAEQKTMYSGKEIATGDRLFIFASETQGGRGLVAKGIVTDAVASARKPGVARQTPRVTVSVRRTSLAARKLGRQELKPMTSWGDGQPGTELNFKLYRQATNKIVGISPEAAAFLESHF